MTINCLLPQGVPIWWLNFNRNGSLGNIFRWEEAGGWEERQILHYKCLMSKWQNSQYLDPAQCTCLGKLSLTLYSREKRVCSVEAGRKAWPWVGYGGVIGYGHLTEERDPWVMAFREDFLEEVQLGWKVKGSGLRPKRHEFESLLMMWPWTSKSLPSRPHV